jgi:ligand-binding sensor domain-containing protein/two-component sensor histidine kinase
VNSVGRYILLFLICCCSSSLLCGQQLSYRHFGINEGLPHSELYAICQGPDKTLWISTDNGLSHYNGNVFINYNPKTVTGSNYVLHATFLSNGRLLVNSYRKGLCFLDNGKFTNITVIANGLPDLKVHLESIYTLADDAVNQCVWAITAGHGLIRFTIKGDTLTAQQHWFTRFNYWVYVDTINQTTYVCNKDGLSRYSNGTLLPVCDAIKGMTITKAVAYDDQHLLLSTNNSLLIYNKQLRTITKEIHFDGGNLHFEYFMYDKRTKLVWLPDRAGGVKIYGLEQPEKRLYHILREVNVNYLFADGLGNTWCCSYGSGLFQFPQLNIVNYNAAEGLKDNYITHISGNGPLNISCLKSFYRFNNPTGEFEMLLASDERKPHNKSIMLPNGKLIYLNAGYLRNNQGDILYSQRSVLYDMAPLGSDTLLLGAFNGLAILSSTYKPLQNNFPVPPQRINKIWVRGDSIILGTSTGVFVRSNGRWQQYNEKNGLPDNIVNDFRVANGKIYATGRSGMALIHSNGKVTQYDKIKTANTSIVGLVIDDWGGMWMATGNGLFLDYGDKLYRFDQYDGLIANDVTAVYAFDGKLFTGTTQGLSIIDLPDLYANLGKRVPCYLQVSLFAENGIGAKRIDNATQLSPNENDIQLNITGPDFYHPQQRLLQYSLDGGKNWSDIVNRQLNLPSLNYGQYHLQVRTKLRNEQQFQTLADYKFGIRLPWYRNVIFIISIVLLLMLLLGWLFLRYYKQKNKRALQQLQVKQQVLDLKQKAMAAMLNPHFVFNSINSINYYIHNGEEEKYTLLLTDLSRLIRLNLNNTYQDSVNLASELEIIQLYIQFEKHRFIRHPLEFYLHYKSSLPPHQVKIPAMMLQPFVENAIWHGVLPKHGGELSLTVSDTLGGYIEVTIQDNGNGFNADKFLAAKKGDVRGVWLIRERIQAYNSLHSRPISLLFPQSTIGFTVVLRFPV